MMLVTFRRFFHAFCAWMGSDMFERWCSPPSSDDEIAHVLGVYKSMGFPGCIGCTDGVSVLVRSLCDSRYKNTNYRHCYCRIQVPCRNGGSCVGDLMITTTNVIIFVISGIPLN